MKASDKPMKDILAGADQQTDPLQEPGPTIIPKVSRNIYQMVAIPMPPDGEVRQIMAPDGFYLHSWEIMKSSLSKNGQTRSIMCVFGSTQEVEAADTVEAQVGGEVSQVPQYEGMTRKH